MRVPRHALVAGALIAVALAACSGDDDATPATTTTADASTTSSAAPGSLPPETTPPSGAIAEAAGWRMEISAPGEGGSAANAVPLCYEVTGTSRESVIALAASMRGQDETVILPEVAAAVGRGEASLDVSSVPSGHYDLVVQLVVDGQPLEGLSVTIPDVQINATRDDARCT
jgi:hypothetical protein